MSSVRVHFTKELEGLRNDLLKMGRYALDALQRAVMAFLSYDSETARQVVENDRVVDEMELRIDQKALNLLALEQPVARDLRLIVAALRMNVDIERIADQAVNIAQRTIRLSKLPPICQPPSFEKLYTVSVRMIEESLGALADGDVMRARTICAMDDEADEANFDVLRTSITFMVEHPSCVEQALQTVIVARCLERSADIATNIAENVIFVVEGKNIKHLLDEPKQPRKGWD